MHLNRREFLKFSGLSAVMPFLPARASNPIGALNVRRVKLAVGAERPFSVLHVSDSHIARIDNRDGDALHAFARARSRIGRELGEYYLCEAAHYAKAAKVKMVHTGDFMDFLSEANLEYARRFLCSYDFLACVGNPKACDALSCEFVERARREPLVRAVLSGHLHGFHDFEFSPHARELVAGAFSTVNAPKSSSREIRRKL